MAKNRLYILPLAAQDLEQIYEPLLSEVIKRIALIQEFPRLGYALAGRHKGWRGTVVGLSRIVYRITGRGIEIGFVRHCKRKPPGVRVSGQ